MSNYGRCPTCGKGTYRAPYSCEECIDAIPDPCDDADGETFENRDFDHEAAIDRDFFS